MVPRFTHIRRNECHKRNNAFRRRARDASNAMRRARTSRISEACVSPLGKKRIEQHCMQMGLYRGIQRQLVTRCVTRCNANLCVPSLSPQCTFFLSLSLSFAKKFFFFFFFLNAQTILTHFNDIYSCVGTIFLYRKENDDIGFVRIKLMYHFIRIRKLLRVTFYFWFCSY